MTSSTIHLSEQKSRLDEKLRRELGTEVVGALAAEDTEDICLNPDGQLWIHASGSGWRKAGRMSGSQALGAIGTMATMKNRVIHEREPILETELPLDGSRFQGLIPPVVTAPCFAIRTRPKRVYTLESYVASGVLGEGAPSNHPGHRRDFHTMVKGKSHAEVLHLAVCERKNILIVGSTGSGKTTLANAVLELIARHSPSDRVLSIEDTMELQNSVENRCDLKAVGPVTMLDCLRAAMRLKPKRIVVGEVRGGEALTLLKAWNTGHPGGVATVHANDAMSGLIRLEALIAEASVSPQPHLIGEAVDVIVFIDEDAETAVGRKVREVMVVEGFVQGEYRCHYV
jgi:type IV secretion system protein TrbB